MDRENLISMFKAKLEKEFQEYIDNLKTKTIDEIINSSYQTSTKEDIVYVMSDCSFLEDKALRALYKAPNSLNEIYDEYSNSDSSYSEDICDSVRYVCQSLMENKKNKDIESR